MVVFDHWLAKFLEVLQSALASAHSGLSLSFLTCEVGGIIAIMLSVEDEGRLCTGAHGKGSVNVLGEVDSKHFIIFLLAPLG